MEEESGKVAKIEYVASLSRHTKAVNVVRFSPCGKAIKPNFYKLLVLCELVFNSLFISLGEYLASSGDGKAHKKI